MCPVTPRATTSTTTRTRRQVPDRCGGTGVGSTRTEPVRLVIARVTLIRTGPSGAATLSGRSAPARRASLVPPAHPAALPRPTPAGVGRRRGRSPGRVHGGGGAMAGGRAGGDLAAGGPPNGWGEPLGWVRGRCSGEE